MRKNVKKIISVMLVLAMVLQVFLPSAFTSHAAGTEEGTTIQGANDVKYVYYTDISQYRIEGKYSYPSEEGYVFAGWWTGITEEEKEANAEALPESTTSDGAWAKYIPEDILTVKAQVSEKVATVLADGTAKPSNTKDGVKLRLVTGVDDSDKYAEIGFRIKVNKDKYYATNKFYEVLTVREDKTSDTVYPTILHAAATEFATYVISGFDTVEEINDKELSVTPYWKTKDGTTVEGTTRGRLLVSDERAVDDDGTSDFTAPEGAETQTGTYTYTATGTSEATSYKYFKGASDTVYLKGQYTPSSDENVKFGIAIRNGGETRQVLFSNTGVVVMNGATVENTYGLATYADDVYVWARKAASTTDSAISAMFDGEDAQTVIWAIENNVLYCSIGNETVLRIPMEKLFEKWQDGRYYQLGVAANGGASESSMTYTLSEDLTLGKNVYRNNKLTAEAIGMTTSEKLAYEPIHGSYKSATVSGLSYVYGNAFRGMQVMSTEIDLLASESTSLSGLYIKSGNMSSQIVMRSDLIQLRVNNDMLGNDTAANNMNAIGVTNWVAKAGVASGSYYVNGKCQLTAAVKDHTLYLFINDKLAGSIDLYKILTMGGKDYYNDETSSVELGACVLNSHNGQSTFNNFSYLSGDDAEQEIKRLLPDGTNEHEWEILGAYGRYNNAGDNGYVNSVNGYDHTVTTYSSTDGNRATTYGVGTMMPQKLTVSYSFRDKSNGEITEDTSGNGIIVRYGSHIYIYGINGYENTFRRVYSTSNLDAWSLPDTDANVKTWSIGEQVYDSNGIYHLSAVVKDGIVCIKYSDNVIFTDTLTDWKASDDVRIGLYTWTQGKKCTDYKDINFEAGTHVAFFEKAPILNNMTYDATQDVYTPDNVSGLAYAYKDAYAGTQVMSATIQLPESGSATSLSGLYIKSGNMASQIVMRSDLIQLRVNNDRLGNDSDAGGKNAINVTNWVAKAGIASGSYYVDGKCELTAAVKDHTLYLFINNKLAGSIDLYKILTMGGKDYYNEEASTVELGVCILNPNNGQSTFKNLSYLTGNDAEEEIKRLLPDGTNEHEWEILGAYGRYNNAGDNGYVNSVNGYDHTVTTYSSTDDNRATTYGVGTMMPQKLTVSYSFRDKSNGEITEDTSGNGIIVRYGSHIYIYGINGYENTFRRVYSTSNLDAWSLPDTDANVKIQTINGQAYDSNGVYHLTVVVKDGVVYIKYNDDVMFKDTLTGWTANSDVRIGLYTWTQGYKCTDYKDISFEAGSEVKVPSTENAIPEGTNISILGDSISTFAGVSNGAAADTSNSTIANNAVYYPNSHSTTLAQNETYWGRIIAKYGMNLLVNNSASGSLVMEDRDDTRPSGINRCTQLHDDTGENSGTNPDIIAVYMGTNDLTQGKTVGELTDASYTTVKDTDGNYITPTTFTEGYIIMLDKIQATYGETADVFCFTLLPSDYNTDTLLNQYNARIRTIAAHYGFTVVDIAAGSGITRANNGKYMDGSHPHANGHALLADTFEEALMLKYATFKTFSN